MQRLAHDARREHLLDRDFLAEHRVRVLHTVAAILHDHLGEVLFGETGFAQQPLRAQREVGGSCGEPRLLPPRLEERGADDALGHLLDAEDERAVVLAGPDRAGRELQRGAAARAAGLDVDDGQPRERQRAEHLVPRRDAAVRGAAERRLERRVAGLLERGAYSVHSQVGRGAALEPSEGMDARPGYANAHVTAPSGNSSATSVSGWPNSSRAGSDSRNRVMTRRRSCTSSTTPKP